MAANFQDRFLVVGLFSFLALPLGLFVYEEEETVIDPETLPVRSLLALLALEIEEPCDPRNLPFLRAVADKYENPRVAVEMLLLLLVTKHAELLVEHYGSREAAAARIDLMHRLIEGGGLE